MNEKFRKPPFVESSSDFHDLEYFLGLEFRYLSSAHGSRRRNILSVIGNIKNLYCLDIGCGGAFLTNEIYKKGAHVIGLDYSKSAIEFGKNRYPHLDLRIQSAYDLKEFASASFDLITFLDVIEHLSDCHKVLAEICRLLKNNGRLIVSTDIVGSPWVNGLFGRFIEKTLSFSSEGRAFKLIRKVEAHRKKFKDYSISHIAGLTYREIEEVLESEFFKIIEHRIYLLVAVPVRDIFLKLLPKKYRGDHQCLIAKKITR